METSAIDELYGDLDQEPRGYSDGVRNNDEDSVDIYSGLEDSPRNQGENGKSRTFSSPLRSAVSMDLYEELITKEQEEKEGTYNELKSKFDAAQNQVQELLTKLQQMQTQNSSLHKENTLLKKNICALIKTARMEIIRKDDEISKLSKRSGRGIFHMSGLDISPASTNHGLYSRRLQYPKGGLELELSQHKDGSSMLNQLSQSTPDATQAHPVARRQCIRSNLNLENPLNCQNKDPGGMESQSSSHARDHRKLIDTAHSKEKNKLCSSDYDRTCHSKEVDILEKPQINMDKDKSEKEQESVNEGCTASRSQNQQHNSSVITRRSGRSRSPTFQTQHSSSSESSSHSSKLPSKVTEDTQHRKEKAQHNQAEKRQRGSTEVCGSRSGANSSTSEKGDFEKSGASLDRSIEKKWSREHHRKEERRHEDVMSLGKRCTRSDAVRESEVQKTHEGRNRHNGSSRDDKRSTRSEASKEPERQSAKTNNRGATDKAKEKPVPGYRDKGHGDVSENRRSDASVKRDLRKDHDKRKSSSRSEEQLYKCKSPKSRDESRGSKRLCASADRSSVKEKYAVIDYEKGRAKSDKKSKSNARSSSKEKSKIDKHGNITAACKKSPKRLTTSSGTSGLEESSPKRKLSFMETLNLTLSPIKMQTNPGKAKEPLQPPPALETDLTEDRVLFELGKEFCVVDETEDSQKSIEAIDSPAAVTGETLQLHPADADTQSIKGQDVNPASKGSPLLLNEKELELPKGLDGDTPDPPADKMCMDAEMKEMEPVTKAGESCTTVSQNSPDSVSVVDRTHLPPERFEFIDSSSAPLADICKEQNKEASVNEIAISKDSSKENQMDNKHEPTPLVQNDLPQQEVSTSVEVKASTKPSDNTSVVLVGVSSTVTVDSDSHIKNFSNTQAAASSDMGLTKVILQENPDTLEEPPAEAHGISSANVEEGVPPELTSYSEPDSTENQGKNIKPSTSVVPPDEDSMIRTLCSIKVIPEAISPLTSPVRQMKKGLQQYLGKEHHVKSLSKDFSSTIATNKDTTKMDMNKENERPDASVMTSVQKDQKEALSSAGAEEELEEGEIISESDEEGALFIQSPPNKNRRLSSRIQSSPRTARLEKTNKTKAAVTPDREQEKNFATAKDSPTSSKRRFKTVTVPPKASISTAAEFLNMFSYIRSELRRKYMKLHKNVTKTAFRCIIDMSLASFTEFIDSVNFHKFCCQGTEIKPRLNKIISTVMSKLSSNGIVNRIFEQRADDLKQKLWNFVDGQFDFLFKEVKAALKRVTDVSTDKSLVNKSSVPKEDLELCKIKPKEPLSMAENRPHTMANIKVSSEVHQKTIPSQTLPCKRRGLGSSGKDIKASVEDGTNVLDGQMCNQPTVILSEKSQDPGYDSKTLQYVRRHSQNGSIQDRSDFEILTEQQTSSLTFNLVTDSQMGDIFRCLLQGSDLLDATVSVGDNQSWPLNTPRKEGPSGENLIGVMTPSKFITPSKVVTTWASISPCKFSSPNSKFQMSVNPALLDENCLMEVPSLAVQSTSALTNPQQPYCILADDLAVSLTVPSPLKSDGHLSFLNPENGQPLSVPSAVITAHYSEDAMLDGEDATEQDIHLSLDTDNSSCGSSVNGNQEDPNTAPFLFKPDLHMQAEVMEKSNDHFVLRIRHTSPEEPKHKHEEAPAESTVVCHEDKISASHASSVSESPVVTQFLTTSNTVSVAQISKEDTSFVSVVAGVSPANLPKTTGSPAEQTATETHASHGLPAIVGSSASESEDASETPSTCHRRTRKRKKHHSGPKTKRNRREKSQENNDKKKHKRSKSSKEKCEKTPAKKSPSPQLSPNSLSAHNVVRKKGAVVVTWTREEDRDILVELKMKGASAKTFAALSTKLRKSPMQIEERFTQLLKLFKKKEKMEG